MQALAAWVYLNPNPKPTPTPNPTPNPNPNLGEVGGALVLRERAQAMTAAVAVGALGQPTPAGAVLG